MSTEVLRGIQKKQALQKEKAEVQLQGLGAGLQLILSQMTSGVRSTATPAGIHLLLGGKRLETCLDSGDTVLFLVILYLLAKEKFVFLHWEQEGQQRNAR